MDLGPPWKRRRPATACNQCRGRKVRCDGAVPCGPCSRSPGRECEYSQTPFFESRSKTAAATALQTQPQPHSRTHSHSQSQSQSQAQSFSQISNCQPLLQTVSSDYAHNLQLFGLDGTDPQQFADYHYSLDNNLASCFPIQDISVLSDIPIESPTLTHAPSITSGASTASRSTSSREEHFSSLGPPSLTSRQESELAPQPMRMRTDSVSYQIPDGDQDFWQKHLQSCSKLQFLNHAFGGRETYQSHQKPLRPHMERFLKLEQLQEKARGRLSPTLCPTLSARDLLPSRSTCHVLVDAYISTFEKVLRILHVPTFLREYEHFWCQPLTFRALEADEPFLCKLALILALGSTVVSDSSLNAASLRKQAISWISYGKRWLARHMGNSPKSDINMAQILCLLALVRHVHDDDESERSEGFHMHSTHFDLARVGMQMGFHRDPLIRSPDMPALEAEMRRRLWATMVELSLQNGLDEGLPCSLSPESFDCKPPSDMTDEELENERASIGSNRKLQVLTPSTILVLLSRTQILRLQCLHLTNSPRASKSYNDSHYLASELLSAHGANMDNLRAMNKEPSDFQLHLLQTYTMQFVRALHEPFTDRSSYHSSAHHYSRKIRTETAMRALSWPPSLAVVPISHGRDRQLSETNACALIRIHEQGYLGRIQRQAAVSLCTSLICDLEEGVFGASYGASWRRIYGVIHDTLLVVEQRVKVSSGTHGKRELLFLSAAEAYIKTLLEGLDDRNGDDAIYATLESAVGLCCEAVDRT